MKLLNNVLIGSGITSLVFFLKKKKKIKIFSSPNDLIIKKKNFYEYDFIGGNSNLWGGYLNYKRHKIFLNNIKYKKFFNNKLFNIKKVFENSKFSNTYCLTNKSQEIFRVKNHHFEKKLIKKKISKIEIKRNKIKVYYKKKFFFTKKLNLCIGNISLIEILKNSNLIKNNDLISYTDGKCNYVLNYFINKKQNYYIPMPIIKIIEKIIFNKSKKYSLVGQSLILQKFSNNSKIFKIKCVDLLNYNNFEYRYFLTNHVVNLKINNVPIREFIRNKSKNINIYCSGVLKKYIPGPIVQDLIFDVVNN